MDTTDAGVLAGDQAIARDRRRLAGFAGAASAGLALGLTELAAGLTEAVPSAISAVGSVVIDRTPAFFTRTAIELFGTADKGALAIGTVVIGLLVGAVVGPLALGRRWLVWAAFAAFAAVGVAACLAQPFSEPVPTVLAVGFAAAAGAATLLRSLDRLDVSARRVEQPTDNMPGDGSRRRFVRDVAGVGATAVVAGVAGRSLIIRRSEEVRTATTLPAPVATVAPPDAGASFAIDGLTPIVVPAGDFYRIDTALIVPRPDPQAWRLRVTGMVETELEYTMADLLTMPLHERYVTLACVSNEVGGGLVGNALWTGVLLSDVLERAGVTGGADQVVGRSVDDFTAGFPTSLVFDGREPLVALGMNGEPLPAEHGFPARLIVPGLYGYVSATKWLQEIVLTTWHGFDGYWIPRGWSKEGPIKTQSRIDVPRRGATVAGDPAVVAGVAWAPVRGIELVEVRFDDGEWEPAELSAPLADTAWVQWRFSRALDPGSGHRVTVRATDGNGDTQTSAVSRPAPDGATGHHSVQFTTA